MKKIFGITVFLIVFFSSLFLKAQLANWTPVPGGTNFPTNVSGQINGFSRISQMKFHPSNPLKYYCVTAEGGLFLSNNQAASWTVAPGTESITNSCAAICIDYTNDQNLFLGTGDANYYSNGSGIFKSTNGGISFSATSLVNCLVIEILQNPTNASEFVAATNKGIYKSSNAGLTWSATTATNIPFCDLKSNAAVNSQTLYAASMESVPKFLRSTDFGSTWTQITAGIVSSSTVIQSGARIAVCPSSTNVVYFSVIGDGGIMHKSNNGGLSFNVKKAGGSPFLTYYSNTVTSSSQGNYNHAITVDANDPAKVWLQAHNTWFSVDSGATWTMLTFWATIVHTDMHQIMQAPFDNTKLYSCNDGGVWLSNDGGNTWTAKSNGLYAYEIGNETGISSLIKKDFVSIGTQDNGKLYSDVTGWFTIGGGDDYAKRQADYNGHIYFDGTNRQLNHTGAVGAYNLPTTNWNSFAFNRTDPNLAFMGFTDVYRCTNLNSSSPTWTAITSFSQTIKVVHSCVANPNRLYVLLASGTLYVSNNALSANPSFSVSSIPTAPSSLGSLVSMANNADILYASCNNVVYRSANAGTSWLNVSYNLPNVNHRRILAEVYGGTQELVLIATNNAVYYKKAGQTTWTNYGTNLPSRRSPTGFSMYDDGTNQSRIRYASYGRAIWESGFDNLRAFSAEILFNDTSITCSSPNIQFNDGSVGAVNAPLSYTWSFQGATPSLVFTSTAAVTYSASGLYTIQLTVKDALNNISTKSITKYIQVIPCNSDTIPGKAINISSPSNYATTPPLALGITNSISISAWIKIDVAQASFAGILFSANGSATGLNFRNGNQIGYHYNDNAATYNYGGGPIIPYNLWTHVALVTSANASTIFVNGVPYVNSVANAAVNFNSGFNLGNDRNNASRTMTGQIDEVCFYNRTLSQNEIRELMHLTRNHGVVDPSLIAYYQCNELGNSIYDRAGNANAHLNASAQHILSTAPVGGGFSERQTINTPGIKTFSAEGLSINFPAATIPNGEICVTRLNIQPDSVPTNKSFSNTSSRYWIINNYGAQAFSPINTMTLSGYGSISVNQSLAPNKFKLYRRATGAYLAASWTKIDSAMAVNSGTYGVSSYSGSAVNYFNTQFTIAKDSCLAAQANASNATASVCAFGTSTLTTAGSLNDNATWKWYLGSCGGTLIASGNSVVVTPSLSQVYYYRGEGGCANQGSCSILSINTVSSPSIPLSIIGSTAICEGKNSTFSVSPVPGASSYTWSLPNAWTGSSINASIAITSSSNSGILSVSAVNACGTSNSRTIAIAIQHSVAISQSVQLCAGEILHIGANSYSIAGTYTDVLTGLNGCDSLVNSIVNVDPPVDTAVTVNDIVLSANAIGAIYQWLDCDNAMAQISGASAKDYTVGLNGHYALKITVNNCVDTSACYAISTVGLKSNYIKAQFKIFPNPSSGEFIVQCPQSLQQAKLMVYDALGRLLIQTNLKGGIQQRIDLTTMAKGIYLVEIEVGDQRFTQKISKE